MWAAAIVVLLPALAWLQYSWLDQIAVADRDRRERTVRTAAAQLAQEFDLELSKAFFALQVDHGALDPRDSAAYAARFASWSSSAANPRMVQAVYRTTAPQGAAAKGPLQLQRWNVTAERFDAAEWPAEMQTLATRLRDQLEQMGRRMLFRRGEGPPPPISPDDPGIMVAPIVHVNIDEPPGPESRPPDVRLVGFTIVQLDLGVLSAEMLPAFVRRHFFDESGHADFRVAVVNGKDDKQVLFESEAGAAAAALDRPDATTSLMSAHGRPFVMFARGERGDRAITLSRRHDGPKPPPPDERMLVNIIEQRRTALGAIGAETRTFGANADGNWRLVAKHRAGSLEAAVASARTRNFALSSGILLLLSAAIGLIIVSARRADRLGRQQMEFVATVSHELRTPVSVIGAAAGNLADGVVADPSRVRKYGETIQIEARRLAETVERVLQLAGIASGRAASLVTLAPGTLVDDALDACRSEIEAAGFDVDVDVSDRLPMISGDRTALRSAMQNLIGNALKYGREAHWIGISARATTAGSQHVIEISIADRGPGIPVDDRAHIFEAFYRGRHAVTHQIQGSGLGLHLVQRIVEAHGGRVTLECDSAPGCRFIVTLPAADASATSEHGMNAENRHHDPAVGHPALEPGQSH
jgi:signal transduction histidine kinase